MNENSSPIDGLQEISDRLRPYIQTKVQIKDQIIVANIERLSPNGAVLAIGRHFEGYLSTAATLAVQLANEKFHTRIHYYNRSTDGRKMHVAVTWEPSPSVPERLLAGEHESELVVPQQILEPASQLLVVDATAELRRYLTLHPERIYTIAPRAFEELIASILKDLGLDIELTKATRDGGVDIYARAKSAIADFVILVECKRWAANRPVGLEIVQRLYGIQIAKHASKSVIITTSSYTQPAVAQCAQYYGLMELKDYNHIKGWLADGS